MCIHVQFLILVAEKQSTCHVENILLKTKTTILSQVIYV